MNIHHLELFFYVAKFEGITQAVRKMPYGIQQPAVSSQILQLEEKLGVKLFNRRPFALTPPGEELYDAVYPFFSRLGDLEDKLKGEEAVKLRIAASASALRNHLPDVLEKLKVAKPEARLTLCEAAPSEVPQLITSQQVDIAIGVLDGKMLDGLQSLQLMSLSPVLWVPETLKARGWRSLLKKNPYAKTGFLGKEPLISLPANEHLQKIFHRECVRLEIDWPTSMEVNSTDVIRDYVLRGFGVGLGIRIPGLPEPAGLKALTLTGFPALEIGAMWQGQAKGMVEAFLAIAAAHVKSLA